MTAVPLAPRRFDRHFRWRGTGSSRLEGFCDAVFAIVLALLFLRSTPPETFADLGTAMKALVPFAAAFAIVAYVWVEHWLFMRRYDLTDGQATALHLLLLFLLLFYAYPLKFVFTLIFVLLFGPIGTQTLSRLAEGIDGPADLGRMFVWYGLGYGAVFGVFALLYARALHAAPMLALDRVERFLTRSAILQCLLQTAIAALSVLLALLGAGVRWGLPGWLYCLIGPVLAVHGVWEGRRLRRLVPA